MLDGHGLLKLDLLGHPFLFLLLILKVDSRQLSIDPLLPDLIQACLGIKLILVLDGLVELLRNLLPLLVDTLLMLANGVLVGFSNLLLFPHIFAILAPLLVLVGFHRPLHLFPKFVYLTQLSLAPVMRLVY